MEDTYYFGIALGWDDEGGKKQWRAQFNLALDENSLMPLYDPISPLLVAEVKERIRLGIVSCCTPDQQPILDELRLRHGIEVPTSDSPPTASRHLIVVNVRGLTPSSGPGPDRRQYTPEEAKLATFEFYRVTDI